ncbi:MAG: general secretion pathway protein GspK [Zetaproteobacteria bacterium]|nr:MAG: general secretion pathway protein GspK [Zetaproteobacteria bacterium]
MALLIVLGLVALISAWAVEASYEDMIELRRAQNIQDLIRARMACLSGLNLAAQLLIEDQRRGNKYDDLREKWARPMPAFEIDEGRVWVRIEDLERYVGLGLLLNEQGKPDLARIQRTKQWFASHGFDAAKVDALVDWMDADGNVSGPAGAEDPSYYERPYHVPNRPPVLWNEIRQIRGFEDGRIQEAMAGTFSAFPAYDAKQPAVNLNTTSVDALLIAFPTLDRADAEGLIDGRPYHDIKQALQRVPQIGQKGRVRLSISSRYFIVTTEAAFGRARYAERFLVERERKKGVRLLARERMVDE